MKSALIIHGTCNPEGYYSDEYPSLSNSHWIPWLQKQLLMRDILPQTPEMPSAYKPVYEDWVESFERYQINADSLLIGHSCGGGFLLRWLSETKNRVSRTILVAPWLDPNKDGADPKFFDFTIDSEVTKRTDLHILVSDNDMEDIEVSVQIIKKVLPDAQYHLFPGYRHFCRSDMNTDAFPELLDIVNGKRSTRRFTE